MNFDELRKKLSGQTGPKYWRSFEEAAGTPEFKEYVDQEFPQASSLWDRDVTRRDFLKYMGASFVMMGLAGCARQPVEKILPYVKSPEDLVPGRPLFYATAMTLGGYAKGLLVESHMGRPTKAEGNPDHPDSLGATDIFGQASVLSLYDPDRSQNLVRDGQVSTWDTFLSELSKRMEMKKTSHGAGLRILTGRTTSPALAAQMKDFLAEYPQARWYQYEPVSRDREHEGLRLAFGKKLDPIYDFKKADVVVSLDADFLAPGPGQLRYTRDFAFRREPENGMNRLYAIDGGVSITGSMADHRLALAPGRIGSLAFLLAKESGFGSSIVSGVDPRHAEWITAVARDLAKHRGSSLVLAGESQPPVVHALAHALNAALGNVGKTVSYIDPVETQDEGELASIVALADDIRKGAVDTLIIADANPVYSAPADLNFGRLVDTVDFSVHLGLHKDETARFSLWHLPAAHFLETWSDARAFDGTLTIAQPLIAPLYPAAKSVHELIATLAGKGGLTAHDVLKDFYATQGTDWNKSLHDGLVAGSASKPVEVRAKADFRFDLRTLGTPHSDYELIFREDPSIWDGRFANLGWLQELPKPFTTMVWDNAALISPRTAESLGVQNGDFLKIQAGGRSLEVPAWILPGHPEEAVTLHLGYGRTMEGRVAEDAGFNAFTLVISSAVRQIPASLKKSGGKHKIVTAQMHHSMENRALVRTAPLDEFKKHPDFAQHVDHVPTSRESLYPEYAYDGYKWGMSINLSTCIGCNACTIACQSENNIPTVGKEEVSRGREMHWIRIDRYFEGDLDDPKLHQQPVTCMHCENAPCEPVCPVEATTHSDEGLNEMTYNRCVGTRYCLNNCPYKVRRFNFLQYSENKSPTLKMLTNPDVTVRFRGIMEKCTYCVQRINVARIQSKKEDRKIRDGEITTACQSVCPTRAIVFGDLNDDKSAIAKVKSDPRDYGLLVQLNTRPRTTYIARVTNPNPELGGGQAHAAHGAHHG